MNADVASFGWAGANAIEQDSGSYSNMSLLEMT